MQSKWWGWGTLDKQYPLDTKPEAWPYLKSRLGLTEEVHRPPVELDQIQLPPGRLSPEALEALSSAVGEINVTTQAKDRLMHAYGRSYRDLLRLRRGEIGNAPDAVVYPAQEAHVEAVIRLAIEHGFAVIPFGGGTSVVGGLEMPSSQQDRPFVSLDMARMADVLSVDPVSLQATVQAGILGPALEEALQAQGVTLGHYPQSFEFSTLGGWVATRSAGQQSTRYGKIEQMVQAVRVVTPTGVLATQPFPASALGPDLNQMAVGSEGIFGVITQVTVRVHPVPERKEYRAMLFPTWQQGADALRQILQTDRHPATLRLSDEGETQALFKLGSSQRSSGQQWLQNVFKWYLRRARDVDMGKSCLLLMGFEGDHDQVEKDRDWCQGICEQHRAVSLGHAIGDRWYETRFELPYMRDTLMDRGVLVDTLETSTRWDNLQTLYTAVREALESSIRADGVQPLVYCHLSHPYHTGASLYFTFVAKELDDPHAQWARYKRAASEAIIANGGAISHHHSVGLDHAPYMRPLIGEEGERWLKGVKTALDPQDVMNPGKILGDR